MNQRRSYPYASVRRMYPTIAMTCMSHPSYKGWKTSSGSNPVAPRKAGERPTPFLTTAIRCCFQLLDKHRSFSTRVGVHLYNVISFTAKLSDILHLSLGRLFTLKIFLPINLLTISGFLFVCRSKLEVVPRPCQFPIQPCHLRRNLPQLPRRVVLLARGNPKCDRTKEITSCA